MLLLSNGQHVCLPAAEGCKGRSFTPNRATARCIDWQKLRLQELLGADQQAQGKVPRSVEVRVLVDRGIEDWVNMG